MEVVSVRESGDCVPTVFTTYVSECIYGRVDVTGSGEEYGNVCVMFLIFPRRYSSQIVLRTGYPGNIR